MTNTSDNLSCEQIGTFDDPLELISVHERGDYEFRVRANDTVQVNLLLQNDDFLIYDVMSLDDARSFWSSL
jgi:hypothetical protein